MKRNELSNHTLEDLKHGTVFTSADGRRMIIGDTDAVAFEDADKGWQVAESVFWNRVEDLTEEDLLGYLLTAADFGTGINGDLLYIGPYKVATDFIRGQVSVDVTSVAGDTRWRVELADGNSFGVAETLEMAWRYALAAELGPIDENFVPFRLK